MSMWTHVQGTIVVRPNGDTTAHSEYILKTVMSHLPDIAGSEGSLDYFINQPTDCNSSSSHDEFNTWAGYRNYNLINMNYFTTNSTKWHWTKCIEQQEEFIITIYGSLRDRIVKDIVRQVNKWLCRLAKRIWVTSVNIAVSGDDYYCDKEGKEHYQAKCFHISDSEVYSEMYERFSWYRMSEKEKKMGMKPEVNWSEFMMVDRDKESGLPWKIIEKYWPELYREKMINETIEMDEDDLKKLKEKIEMTKVN